MLKKQLLNILACPACKSEVSLDDAQENVICRTCQISYPIKNGFPAMLKEEAKPLDVNAHKNK